MNSIQPILRLLSETILPITVTVLIIGVIVLIMVFVFSEQPETKTELQSIAKYMIAGIVFAGGSLLYSRYYIEIPTPLDFLLAAAIILLLVFFLVKKLRGK